ncbi:CGNR zinc finger domain-containing protein [Nocardia cyriacigeorgica]
MHTPPPGARRWCAMERCGNRHKLRALRARQAMQR